VPLADNAPIITNNPIWLAESAHLSTLALPEESPEAVLALAHRFGAKLLVVTLDDSRQWPGILDKAGPASACFREVSIAGSVLAQVRVFRVICP